MATKSFPVGALIALLMAGCASAPPRPLEQRTIVIDPGHGGTHTGYVGPAGTMEKDVTLDVALGLKQVLTGWGAEVVLTRLTDQTLSSDVEADLAERRSIRNRAKPDLFISIHTDGVRDHPDARGFEAWIPSEGRTVEESRRFAELVCKELGSIWGAHDRGIRDQHNLQVLKGTECPAVLVELEFISNPVIEKQLANTRVRRRLAEALAEAIRKLMTQQS